MPDGGGAMVERLQSRRRESMIGLKELAVLAAVVLALYGRSGVLKSRRFQAIWPWIAPVRRPAGGARIPRDSARAPRQADPAAESAAPRVRAGRGLWQLEGNRVFWFTTILAATAVAAWVVTRVLILSGTITGTAR
jgi:hypothetical protein